MLMRFDALEIIDLAGCHLIWQSFQAVRREAAIGLGSSKVPAAMILGFARPKSPAGLPEPILHDFPHDWGIISPDGAVTSHRRRKGPARRRRTDRDDDQLVLVMNSQRRWTEQFDVDPARRTIYAHAHT